MPGNKVGKVISFDTLVADLAALGVPALVLLAAISATGLTGAASITAALAMLGPGGMVGGIALLGFAGLASRGVAKFGFDRVFCAVLKRVCESEGGSQQVIEKLDSYPISNGLKWKIKQKMAEA